MDSDHHSRRPQPKPFYLFSSSGQSIKRAVSAAKKTPGLGKTKVCVVSIICKDKLNGTIRDKLVRSLLGKSYKQQSPTTITNEDDEGAAKDHGPDHFNPERESLPQAPSDLNVSLYETQVIGNIDCDSNLVVLSLNSILEADKLCQIVKPPEEISNFLISPDWSLRSQNLIKTLHIMLSVSHVVVFYSPDLCFDHNLVQTLKILEVLRLKSQTRVTDLLETIEFRKYLPEKWIKQGRLCTPRSLFVFGTSDGGVNLKQSDVITTKRNLEDLIYMTLKKANIVHQANQKHSPIFLPERDEFVFILSGGQSRSQVIKDSIPAHHHTEGHKNTLDSFYHELMNSLGYVEDSTMIGSDQTSDARRQTNSSSSRYWKPINPPVSNEGLDKGLVYSLEKFKKFVQRHVSDIRSNLDQHGRHSNFVLPNYENLLAVLANMADLFFPIVEDELGLPSALQIWRKPDERRFVDIHNLLNHEEAFSKSHCHQAREAAFAMFSDKLTAMPARNQTNLSKLLQPIMQSYLTQARGSASLTFRDLLEQDCRNHWDDTRDKKSTRPAKNKLFSVSRQPDEIILTSSCECGRKCSFKVHSKDKRNLDGVYINRLKGAESS